METTCNWPGQSGIQYKYWVHPLPTNFDPNQLGNYIYTKIVNNVWQPIYFGEGDLRERIDENHHRATCIKNKGATHVHVHTAASKVNAEREESDLLANFPQAYAPTGCNVKVGG